MDHSDMIMTYQILQPFKKLIVDGRIAGVLFSFLYSQSGLVFNLLSFL